MSQTNILLEAGTNELEIVEFFLDEPGENGATYRGCYGVNVAKVLEIIQMPKITALSRSYRRRFGADPGDAQRPYAEGQF